MVFTSKHNMEMTKSEKLLKKTKQKILPILFDMTSPKKGRGSELSQHLFSKQMVFTNKRNMEMTKSEILLKKTENKFSGIFFDITSSTKGRVSGLS